MNIWSKIKFVVSCQALEGEPLFGPGIVLKLVDAVIAGGVKAVRLSQIENIKDVQQKYPDLPIIGIIKKDYSDNPIYITPTLSELKALVATNISIIAIDATLRKRPQEDLSAMVQWFTANKRPHQYLMADCADLADVQNAIALKFDFISTTLRGYTAGTQNLSGVDDKIAFARQCVALCKPAKIPLVAEGGLNDPISVKRAWAVGADMVVVGSAITRPKFIVEQFLKAFADH